MKLSMFNRNAWRYASGEGNRSNTDNGYGRVIIRKSDVLNSYKQYNNKNNNASTLTQISGSLNAPLNLDYSSSWVDLYSSALPSELKTAVDSVGNLASGAIMLAGGGQAGAQYTERLIWAKSGHLELNLDIAFIDWHEDSTSYSPLDKLKMLVNYTLSAGDVFDDILKNVIATATPFINQGKEAVYTVLNKAGIDTNDNRVVDLIANMLVNGTEDILDYISVKKSPVPVTISIGNIVTASGREKPIFKHDDMVIENLNFQLSQEVTARGPLRIDVKIKAKSRKLINGINNTGLANTFDDKGRVFDSTDNSSNTSGTVPNSDKGTKNPTTAELQQAAQELAQSDIYGFSEKQKKLYNIKK